MAFNKSIATEAKSKFPKEVECRTVHSLAWEFIVKRQGIKIESFTYSSIKEKIAPELKEVVLAAFREFCSSDAIDLKYFKRYDEIDPQIRKLCVKYIHLMVDKEISMPFELTLKLFHIYLQDGTIPPPSYDLLMLDEAGDTTGVILEIFKLLQAPQKIMVGDNNQNIYEFMYTINGFEKLSDEGIQLPLSQSFRVSNKLAPTIQKFCNAVLDSTMIFKGIDYPEEFNRTYAYISRTNSVLIERMIELNENHTPYSLLRPASEIFDLPLALIFLPKGQTIKPEYLHIKVAYDTYIKSEDLQKHYRSHLDYLSELFDYDTVLQTAIRLLRKHTYKIIFDTYNIAKSIPKYAQPITLCTAHSSKG